MLNEANLILRKAFYKKDFSFLIFSVSMFLLPLSINLGTFTFILASLLNCIQILLKRNKFFATKALKNASIIGLCFFIYILANSILQANIFITLQYFEKQYMHFALFFLTPIFLRQKKDNKLLIYAFFLGTFIAVFYVFFYAILNSITFNKYAFLNVLDIHHTYLAMYMLTFVNYCIVDILISKTRMVFSIKVAFMIIVLIAFGILYLINSKVGMLIFLILFLIHTLPKLSQKNIIINAGILIFILTIITFFNNKVTINYEAALDFRLQIWEMSFKTFEENPFFGNSSLPEKDILNYKHYIKGKYYFLDSDLNSHNQYLSVLMRFGAIGFVILAFYGINVFRKISSKTKKQDIRQFFGFLIIALLAFYTENILDRHHGIVYITFFYNYYLVAIENAES